MQKSAYGFLQYLKSKAEAIASDPRVAAGGATATINEQLLQVSAVRLNRKQVSFSWMIHKANMTEEQVLEALKMLRPEDLPYTPAEAALAALRRTTTKDPGMSFGRMIEALTKGRPTPYAWLGAAGDDTLAEAIGQLGAIAASTDDTPATAVLDLVEKEMSSSPNSSVGDYLQLMVSVFAAKNPALMPSGNRTLLVR